MCWSKFFLKHFKIIFIEIDSSDIQLRPNHSVSQPVLHSSTPSIFTSSNTPLPPDPLHRPYFRKQQSSKRKRVKQDKMRQNNTR